KCQVEVNPGHTPRQGDVAVNDQRVPVRQDGKPCQFDIAPKTQSVAADGGSVQVNVTTASDCAWIATSAASWVTINSGAAGTGSGRVSATAQSNGGNARDSILTIAGEAFAVSPAAPVLDPPPT